MSSTSISPVRTHTKDTKFSRVYIGQTTDTMLSPVYTSELLDILARIDAGTEPIYGPFSTTKEMFADMSIRH
jgi:hypothetical protein